MKAISLIAVCFSLALAGCSTTPSASSVAEKAKSPATVRMVTSAGASLALANNPRYVPAAKAIIAAIDSVGDDQIALTEETITKFVANICVKNGMSATEAVVYTSLARNAYVAYVEDFHPSIVLKTDPTVRLYIDAFKNGLTDALAIIDATNPAPTA